MIRAVAVLPVLCSLSFVCLVPAANAAQGKQDPKPGSKTPPAVHHVHKRAKIKLSKSFKKSLKMKIGKHLEAETAIHLTDFFNKPAISGQLDIHNKSKKKLYISYHLGFFDKDGNMLGCASQNMDFDAGEKTTVGGCLIRIPADAIKKVVSYQLQYWESEQKL